MEWSKKIIFLVILVSFISFSHVSGEDASEYIKLKINDTSYDVKLDNNSATDKLKDLLKDGNITVEAEDYGNFEKVGDLGFSLPANDENINTSSGDIVLYQGDKVSLFYDSHSWSYTKLGKIENISSTELKEILGSGDVSLTFSLK